MPVVWARGDNHRNYARLKQKLGLKHPTGPSVARGPSAPAGLVGLAITPGSNLAGKEQVRARDAPYEAASGHAAARRGWPWDGGRATPSPAHPLQPAPDDLYARPRLRQAVSPEMLHGRCPLPSSIQPLRALLGHLSSSRRPCTTGGPPAVQGSGLGCAGPNRCTWRPRLLAAGSPSRTRREPGRRVAACASPSEPQLAALG